MKRLLTFVCAILLASAQLSAQTSTTEVLLKTTAGDIRIALYDETPQHRDNFLKLTKMGSYDSLLFHRVIKDFMVQSGDIFSKNAKPGQLLGMGDYEGGGRGHSSGRPRFPVRTGSRETHCEDD